MTTTTALAVTQAVKRALRDEGVMHLVTRVHTYPACTPGGADVWRTKVETAFDPVIAEHLVEKLRSSGYQDVTIVKGIAHGFRFIAVNVEQPVSADV